MLPVSWDNRRFLDRLRRVQLYEVCNHFSVPFQMGATAISMRDSLVAHNITEASIQQYFQDKGKLQVVRGQDESGREHTEVYPVSEDHQSLRLLKSGQEIDYEGAISANAERVAEKEAVIEEQAGVMENLMEMVSDLKAELADMRENSLPMERMTPPQLKGVAKRRGIDVKGLKTSKEILERINQG